MTVINDCAVSVLCTTYNQKKYIAKTLESFVSQNVSFKYEVIVHDDCSNDGTSEIIDEYRIKYPNLIKHILPKQNLYSKGINVPLINALNYCNGTYIAFCEGDDYWCSNNKLQTQYDVLQSFDMIDLCFSKANVCSENGLIIGTICDYGSEIKIISFKDVLYGGGGAMPSPSLFFRKKILDNVIDWLSFAPVGDIFIQGLGAKNGGAIYIPMLSSVYRANSNGSWSESKMNVNPRMISRGYFGYMQAYKRMVGVNGGEDVTLVNYPLARELYYLATKAIRKKMYGRSKVLILKSWSLHPELSIGQKVFYLMRDYLFFLNLIFSLKDFFDERK
ncbi:Glycosyltransferase involved in cell wall bisynthesis [Shewanella morhuae]|uniref:glycosyltransferase n=1 Tax=Shewanella morhuae TaxID=365591 RepID=UPI000954995A|nr:glycosyltransferase [Shewanella morhuae]SIQ50847.1 Glycosyltransferase involved in cell wall bisynthesis [Shewanella morhuae]